MFRVFDAETNRQVLIYLKPTLAGKISSFLDAEKLSGNCNIFRFFDLCVKIEICFAAFI